MGSPRMGDVSETTQEHAPGEEGREQSKREEEEETEEKERGVGGEGGGGGAEAEAEEKERGVGGEGGGGGAEEEKDGQEVTPIIDEGELEGRFSLIPITKDPKEVSVIKFEDFQEDCGRHLEFAAVISPLRSHRDILVEKLQSMLKIHKQAVNQIDELEVLKLRLKSKDQSLENARVSLQEKSEDLAIAKGKLRTASRSLLTAANSLAAARSNLQDVHKYLRGEGGQDRLLYLRSMLRTRRRLMVSQIAALYPIGQNTAPSEQDHLRKTKSQTDESGTKDSRSSDKGDFLHMTIKGLLPIAPLIPIPGITEPGELEPNNHEPDDHEPNDHQSSATAHGYAAHCLSLLAGCLNVDSRYPVRLGASRSYIQDYARIVESTEGSGNSIGPDAGVRSSFDEFPLFTEKGQGETRAAYAVFLLNKDLEQVLNYMGAESVGPRHTIPNLDKIIKLVCSGASTTV